MIYYYSIETIFALAVFINALLFIPQIITVIKHRSARDISLVTFVGFLVIQLITLLHALHWHDSLLIVGASFSLLLCASLVILMTCYRGKTSTKNSQAFSNGVIDFTLEELMEQFPGHLYWKNAEGKCLGASKKQYEELGFQTLDELIGKTEFDLFPPEQAKEIAAIDREVVSTETPLIVEEMANNAKGEPTYYISAKAPLRDKKNNAVGIIGMSIDITKIRTEQHQRIELLERIISLLPGIIHWKDRTGKFMGCNLAQARQAGFDSIKDIIGKTATEILPKNLSEEVRHQQAEAMEAVDREVIRSGKLISMEELFINKSGKEEIYLSQKTPLFDAERNIVGILAMSMNITNQKNIEREKEQAKEAAEAVNQLKQEILYNLRHDIRTPFSGIIGVAQLLKERLNEEHLPLLVSIESSAEQLLSYLNDILEFSQIETGSIPVLLKPFNFKQLCEECVTMLTPAIKNKSLSINLYYDEQLPDGLITDAFRLKRILVNLLSNAAKFTQVGKIDLQVSGVKRIEHSILVKIAVIDTGIGIPEEKYQVIFEKFSRLSSAYIGAHKGLGLGLQAVKNLVEDLEGEIQVESQIGKGTTFTCMIPMQLRIEDRFRPVNNG